MAKKKINITLSSKSINDAIKRLQKYSDELERKNEVFVRRLTEIGINVINMQVSAAKGDSSKAINIDNRIRPLKNYVVARIEVTGQDILFLEFGAGIHYNSGNSHPKAGEFGYGVGTYPGATHSYDDFWFYVDDNGDKHMSNGAEATMPVYRAYEAMYKQVAQIAREVFGG